MYQTTDSKRKCFNCRWFTAGSGGRGECRYFDRGRERAEEPETAAHCPFFEDRAGAARVAALCDAICRVAEAIEALQGGGAL